MDEEQKPVVCVDLDGVLNAFDGWKGADFSTRRVQGLASFFNS